MKLLLISRLLLLSRSVVSDSATPWTATCQSLLSLIISQSLPSSYSLNRRCHPTVSSSVIPFFSCLQSFPTSGFFLRSRLFTSGGQSIGVSASASVPPMYTQDWSPLEWTGWISYTYRKRVSLTHCESYSVPFSRDTLFQSTKERDN